MTSTTGIRNTWQLPADGTFTGLDAQNMYRTVADASNTKEMISFDMPISDSAQDILRLPSLGSYIICVSSRTSDAPTLIAALCKSDETAAGSVAVVASQAGTNAWAGNVLTITSTATSFQIAHDRASFTADFKLVITGLL